jgi:hypothetical protein
VRLRLTAVVGERAKGKVGAERQVVAARRSRGKPEAAPDRAEADFDRV